MGKTLFMKMSCDRINYADRKKWKSYAAFITTTTILRL